MVESETDNSIIIESGVIKHIEPKQPHPLRKFSQHGIGDELHGNIIRQKMQNKKTMGSGSFDTLMMTSGVEPFTRHDQK